MLLNFILGLLTKLAGPVLAFFAGSQHEKKKEAEHAAAAAKEQAEALAKVIALDDSVDRSSAPDELRDKLNNRP